MMGTVSNMVLNHIIAGYSNVAVAGMGIAKKTQYLAAFAVGQGITQGTLPLIGYNYTSGNKSAYRTQSVLCLYSSLAVALAIAVLLYIQAPAVEQAVLSTTARRWHMAAGSCVSSVPPVP